MRSKILRCVLAAMALNVGTPILADWTSPKPFGVKPATIPNRKMSDDDKARQVTNDYAICLVKKSSRRIEDALLQPMLSDSYNALKNATRSDCLAGAKLFMPSQLVRGAAFRALYIKDFGKTEPQQPKATIDFLAEAQSNDHEREQASLKAFGSCVAQTNPSAARELVLATVGSSKEDEAIASLRPILGDCLKDGSLKINRAMLQATIAEVLYRQATLRPAPQRVR